MLKGLHWIPNSDPNHLEDGHDLVTWPKFTSPEEAYLNIALEPSVMYKLHPDRMAFWNDFIPKLMDIEPKTKNGEKKQQGKDELWETNKSFMKNRFIRQILSDRVKMRATVFLSVRSPYVGASNSHVLVSRRFHEPTSF